MQKQIFKPVKATCKDKAYSIIIILGMRTLMVNEIMIKVTLLTRNLHSCSWHFLLNKLRKFFDSPLAKLDDNDPLRRNSHNIDEDIKFICKFKKEENDKYIFGRYKKCTDSLMIWIRKREDRNFRREVQHRDGI